MFRSNRNAPQMVDQNRIIAVYLAQQPDSTFGSPTRFCNVLLRSDAFEIGSTVQRVHIFRPANINQINPLGSRKLGPCCQRFFGDIEQPRLLSGFHNEGVQGNHLQFFIGLRELKRGVCEQAILSRDAKPRELTKFQSLQINDARAPLRETALVSKLSGFIRRAPRLIVCSLDAKC